MKFTAPWLPSLNPAGQIVDFVPALTAVLIGNDDQFIEEPFIIDSGPDISQSSFTAFPLDQNALSRREFMRLSSSYLKPNVASSFQFVLPTPKRRRFSVEKGFSMPFELNSTNRDLQTYWNYCCNELLFPENPSTKPRRRNSP